MIALVWDACYNTRCKYIKEGKIAPKRKFYQINQYIKAQELRVIDDEGKQVGVISTRDAINLAREKNLDLVEISPFAKPPIAKIIDFKKFQYLERKKQRDGAKKNKKVELKEIRLSPFIAEGDLNNRLERTKEFLTDGNRVKIVIKFVGRQITRKEFGYELLDKVVDILKDFAGPDGEPKLQGKRLMLILNPSRKNKNEKENTEVTK